MLTWLSLLDIGKDVQNIHPNYIFGLNFSIRKSTMLEMRGFHPDNVPSVFQMWQGDGETGLTMKILRAGRRADYIQKAKLFHQCFPERLTIEYFLKRAYYQGVCNSFTTLREGLKEIPIMERVLAMKNTLIHLLSDANPEHDVTFKYTNLASIAARIDHALAVENNLKIREWILKDNYIDSCINKNL